MEVDKNPCSLWGKVMVLKYCPKSSILEWIRKLDKSHKNGSIGWKPFMLSFPLIKDWLAWNVGDGKQIWIGEESWIGSGDGYNLSLGTT